MKTSVVMICAILLFANLSLAQIVTIGSGSQGTTNGTCSYPAPYAACHNSSRQQYFITRAELLAAGAPAVGIFNSLAFNVAWYPNSIGGSLQAFSIQMGHTTVAPNATVNPPWQTGLTTVLNSTSQSPSVGWNTHTFDSPFAWNGFDNIVIEVCSFTPNTSTNTKVFWDDTGLRVSKVHYSYTGPDLCLGTLDDQWYLPTKRPMMQFNMTATQIPLFQVNQTGAFLNINGVLATSSAAAITHTCPNAITTLNANSMGNVAELFLNGAAVLPSNGGGAFVSASNVINLDLAAGISPLLGAFIPWGASAGTSTLAFVSPSGTVSIQMLAIDPTAPGALKMSQACQLEGNSVGSITLPNLDDAITTITLADAPLYRAPVVYYGTSYTQIGVSTNGRMFLGSGGVANNYASATYAISEAPSFGIFVDLEANWGGPTCSIIVSACGAPNSVEVSFTNVPYIGVNQTATFRLGIDDIGPRIEGISGLQAYPLVFAMIYMSVGNNIAVNTGQTAFGIGSGTTLTNNSLLYKFGAVNPNLGGGANNIRFSFNSTGGVDWTGS